MTVLLYRIEDFFEKLPIHWMWWPALGVLAVGLGGLIEPRALGVGYDIIADLLANHFVAQAILTILLVKSGTSGGVLAPLLILGGALGYLVGLFLPGEPGIWALLGMAAMMAGTMRAPLTGIFFAIEITGDPGMAIPLLIATIAAYSVTVLMMRRSILTEKIARRGQHITREYAVDAFELTRAAKIMIRDVDTLPATMKIREVIQFFISQETHRTYPVVKPDGVLIGVVSRADILLWQQETHDTETLGNKLAERDVVAGHEEDTVGTIADLMLGANTGRVAIVNSSNVLIGLVTRKDLLHLRRNQRAAELERRPYLRSA